MRPRLIEVEIDELVLEGLDAVAGRSVADALESELAAQLRCGSQLSLQSKQRVEAGPIGMPLRSSSGAMGRAIARAVGKELG